MTNMTQMTNKKWGNGYKYKKAQLANELVISAYSSWMIQISGK